LSENTQIKTPIDPFSTQYWEPAVPIKKSMEPPRIPLNAMKGTSSSVNGPNTKAVKIFGTYDPPKPPIQPSIASKPPKKLLGAEDLPSFKEAVQGSELSKLGLIEVLNKQFSKVSKATIKYSLETYAHRVGTKEADKRWAWIEDSKS